MSNIQLIYYQNMVIEQQHADTKSAFLLIAGLYSW
jgi:hypothetical protein